jgi:hypothetical protein
VRLHRCDIGVRCGDYVGGGEGVLLVIFDHMKPKLEA